jgi:hypothetical protein
VLAVGAAGHVGYPDVTAAQQSQNGKSVLTKIAGQPLQRTRIDLSGRSLHVQPTTGHLPQSDAEQHHL